MKRTRSLDDPNQVVTADMTRVQEDEAQNELEELESAKSFAFRARSEFPTTRSFGLIEQLEEPCNRPSRSRLRLYLVRHGESEANLDTTKLFTKSDHIVTLSEEGRRQAREVGEWFKGVIQENTRVIVSPYKRARDTADVVVSAVGADRLVSLTENIFLGEQQFGLFEGMSLDQIKEEFPREHAHFEKNIASGGRFYARMPLGESRFDVVSRVCRVIDSLVEDEFYSRICNVIVVAHGITLRAFAMAWLSRTHEWFESQPNPNNCSVRLIEGTTDRGYVFPGFKQQPSSSSASSSSSSSHPNGSGSHFDKEQDLVALSSQHSADTRAHVDVAARLEEMADEIARLRHQIAANKPVMF